MRIPLLRGFTLIETLVAVSLFSVLMVMTIGSLTVLIDANRKARSEKAVINNVNAALEIMARSIREGTDYNLSRNDACPDQTDDYCVLSFTSSAGEQIEYRVNGTTIERRVGAGDFTAITAPDVTVETLSFTAVADNATDEVPKIQIAVKAKTEGDAATAAEFNVQTSVSQRFAFDVPVDMLTGGTCGDGICGFGPDGIRETNASCPADCNYDNVACPNTGDSVCGLGESDTGQGAAICTNASNEKCVCDNDNLCERGESNTLCVSTNDCDNDVSCP